MSNLLLINIEIVVILNFLVFARFLHIINRLNRIVLDKTYFLFITKYYCRKIIIVEMLRRISYLFVCIITILSLCEIKDKNFVALYLMRHSLY